MLSSFNTAYPLNTAKQADFRLLVFLGAEWLPRPVFTCSYVPDHEPRTHTLAAYCTLCADTL